MDPLIYTIYDIAGLEVSDIWILVHMATEPDNALTFRSAIVRRSKGQIVLEKLFDEWVTSMWQSPSGIIYAVSMAGTIHTLAEGAWTTTRPDGRLYLNNVWGLNDQSVYICGMDGVFLRKRGTSWERSDGPPKGDLTRVGGTSEDDLYVLGPRGTMFHFDGALWSAVESPTNRKLLNLFCASKNDVYVCGRSGTLFHGSPNKWQQMEVSEATLHSVIWFRDTVFVGAGVEGLLQLRRAEVISSPSTVAYGLQLIGQSLFAFGNTQISEYDGNRWSGETLDFATIVT